MTYAALVEDVARRTGLPARHVRLVLAAVGDAIAERLQNGDTVRVPGIGTWRARWSEPRTIRSVHDSRRVSLTGKWRPGFRAARALKQRLAGSGASTVDTEIARVANALLDDLVLYSDGVPRGINRYADPDEVHHACLAHFGPAWTDLVVSFRERLPDADPQPLIEAAKDRFALKLELA